MPPRLDRLPKDLRGDDKLLHEQSAQWSADYLAYAFSNIVKKGDVHRVKTLAILYVHDRDFRTSPSGGQW